MKFTTLIALIGATYATESQEEIDFALAEDKDQTWDSLAQSDDEDNDDHGGSGDDDKSDDDHEDSEGSDGSESEESASDDDDSGDAQVEKIDLA